MEAGEGVQVKFVELTWGRVVKVWWSLIWRGLLFGFLGGFIIGFIIAFILTMLRVDQNDPIVNQITGTTWSPYRHLCHEDSIKKAIF